MQLPGVDGGAPTTVYTLDRLNSYGIWLRGYDIFFTIDEGHLRQGDVTKAEAYNALLLNPIARDDWFRFIKSEASFIGKTFAINNGSYRFFKMPLYDSFHIEETLTDPTPAGCSSPWGPTEYIYSFTLLDDDGRGHHYLTLYTYQDSNSCDSITLHKRLIVSPSLDGTSIKVTTPDGTVIGTEISL